MQTNEKKKNNILKIICLLITLITIAFLVKYAWAKYMSMLGSQGNADIARWVFKVNGNDTQTTNVANFAITRTDTDNDSVAPNVLAPGTEGKFEIFIDAKGTETMLQYIIDIDLTNKPENLKFYSDENKTKEIEIKDIEEKKSNFTKNGYMLLDDIKEKDETVYWEWKLETGSDMNEIRKNDELDSSWIGNTMEMQISVTGMQILEGPTLSEIAEVGDIVNYNAGETISETEYSYEDFSSTDEMTWRILDIDSESGNIKLFGITSKEEWLGWQGGYNNGIEILDNIAKVYGHGKGAIESKSITIEDIDKLTTYNKYDYAHKYGNSSQYNGIDEIKYGDTKLQLFSGEGLVDSITFEVDCITDNGITSQTVSKGDTVMVQELYYRYKISDYKKEGVPDKVYEILESSNMYWIASRYCHFFDSDGVRMGYRKMEYDTVGGSSMFKSDGKLFGSKGAVGVIVTLNSDIHIKAGTHNGWELDV